MIKLVASDLDGTLFDSNHFISQKNLNAISDLNHSQLNFAICTGKTYSMIKHTCDKLNASYGIFGNGNQIVDLKSGTEIYKKLLDDQDALFCIQFAKKEHLHIHLYTENEVISESLQYLDLRNYKLHRSSNSELSFKIVDSVEDYISQNQPHIFKLVISKQGNLNSLKEVLSSNSNLNIQLVRKYDKYKDFVINKEYEYLDIMPKGINKNHALTILENYLNITKDEVMAIGDNLNDIEMIQNSGIGIAVANAYDEVKEVADYTTSVSAHHGGFAEAVYKFIPFK